MRGKRIKPLIVIRGNASYRAAESIYKIFQAPVQNSRFCARAKQRDAENSSQMYV